MSDIFKKILIAGAVIVAALALSFMVGQRHALKRLISLQKEIVDTLVIYETKLVEKPVFVEKKVIEKVLVPVRDTIRVNDTLFVYAEREQIHWKDTLSDVYASGIEVNVDSVRHYIPMQVITKEKDVIVKVKPKWSIGVHAGYGAFAKNGQITTSPYIGVGISYNILSW